MTDFLIEANIAEVDGGAYYPVKLRSVPNVGELIDLYSFADTVIKHQPRHFYEVVQVLHQIYDVTDKTDPPHTGHHFVTVFVKPSQNKYFTA